MSEDIERDKLELERDKYQLDMVAKAADARRADNQSIENMLNIVKYLNSLRDGSETITDEGFEKTTCTIKGREWNPLEEDLANASLKAMQVLVNSLINKK